MIGTKILNTDYFLLQLMEIGLCGQLGQFVPPIVEREVRKEPEPAIIQVL